MHYARLELPLWPSSLSLGHIYWSYSCCRGVCQNHEQGLLMNESVKYRTDEVKVRLQQTFRYWGVLLLLFNILFLANLYYHHEDFFRRIPWWFLLFLYITANSLISTGLLAEVYVLLWCCTRTTWLRHTLRMLFFIGMTATIIWSVFWHALHIPIGDGQ